MADIAKLNTVISNEEGKINNNYYLIEKLYVSMHAAGCEDKFKGMVPALMLLRQNKRISLAD